MRTRLFGVSILGASMAFAAIGCGSGGATSTSSGSGGGSGGTGQTQETVELFSWWIAPGEAQALQALIDTFDDVHPHSDVTNSGTDTAIDVKMQLAERIDTNPPDLFQMNAQDVPKWLTDHPDTLTSLDDFFNDPALAAAVIPDVREQVTVQGHVYNMPVGVYRENTLFYNKQIFAAQHLNPPTTISEFFDVCGKLKTAGITPVAMSYQGWILRGLFNDLVMGTMGSALFRDFMSGAKRPDDPDVKAGLMTAIDSFGQVLTQYIDVTQASDPNFGWTQAADAMKAGTAAMFPHGDWAKGYLIQVGWTPGVDFGSSGPPGASDVFWYGVDGFAFPTLAVHAHDAHDFLSVTASPDGQVAFNRLKGSTPMRTDVRDRLDDLGKATLDDFVNATSRIPVVATTPWDEGFVAFAMNQDKDALYNVFVTNPPGQL